MRFPNDRARKRVELKKNRGREMPRPPRITQLEIEAGLELDHPAGQPSRRAPKERDRKSTRLNSSHGYISYAVFCLKKKKKQRDKTDVIEIHTPDDAPDR